MANQQARQDDNDVFALIGHSDTSGTAETRKVVVNNGAISVQSFSPFVTSTYDTINATYPNGTTDIYSYLNGTIPVGTVTVTYDGTAKTNLVTAIKTF